MSNIVQLSDASYDKFFSIFDDADKETFSYYLYDNDAQHNIDVMNRQENFQRNGGREYILHRISQAFEEIQWYLDYILIQSYERVVFERNEIKWFADEEDEEYEITTINRNYNNIQFEFNIVEDSIKIYYFVGNILYFDIFIY